MAQGQPVLQFVIIGEEDCPIFDADLMSRSGGTEQQQQEHQQQQRPQYLYHFVLHASLDAVDDQEWNTNNMYLGAVDRFNNLVVSAWTTGSRIRMLLLHDGRNEETVRTFFKSVHEVLIPLMLNPFFVETRRITSVDFHSKVRRIAKNVFKS